MPLFFTFNIVKQKEKKKQKKNQNSLGLKY